MKISRKSGFTKRSTNKSKMLIASTIVVSGVAGVAALGDINGAEATVDKVPSKPYLIVPNKNVLEYGDKHLLGWGTEDINNDTLTYTLQANYGNAWVPLYTGTARVFEYIVPNGVANVKFRVIASNGSLTATSNESNMTVREPLYRWARYEGRKLLGDDWQRGEYIESFSAEYDAYNEGFQGAGAGFLYREGRLIDYDNPPIIELSGKFENAKSKVIVKTHDLGTVQTVKWAKGNQSLSYFSSNGTTLSETGQNTLAEFIVDEIGLYTVYAVDNNGNKSIQTIEIKNSVPTKPTLTVPSTQFEHGDEHIIGWNSTDAENDLITYTLEVTYDSGNTWDQLYVGTDKTYTYTVPNDKGTKVQFRVTANDGKVNSETTTSVEKSIREVMYYWNKYTVKNVSGYSAPSMVERTTYSFHENGTYSYYREYRWDSAVGFVPVGSPTTALGKEGVWSSYYVTPTAVYRVFSKVRDWQPGPINEYMMYYSEFEVDRVTSYPTNYETYGTLVTTLQGTGNAYNNNVKNSDGFWYIRGQRVLSDDITPPIIELNEQSDYGVRSTVTVKTHDLGTVQTVKWAKGEQNIAYFTSNGTALPTGQSTPSSFTVAENGMYTVYAVDAKGNEAVQIINVKNINLPPEISTISTSKFNVADNTTLIEITGFYTDRENHNVSVAVMTDGKNSGIGTGSNGSFSANATANELANGIHENPFSVSLNDGIVSGVSVATTNHIVIKVEDAAEYSRLLHVHTNEADSYTKAQHQAFLTAYEAVRTYEIGRTQTEYDNAKQTIADLIVATEGVETATTNEWNERLALVFATVELEKAEISFELADYEAFLPLYDDLSQVNKDKLKARYDELTKYHVANTLLLSMEAGVNSHKANASTVLDTTIINTVGFNDIKGAIASLQDGTPAPSKSYKADLNKRLDDVKAYFLQHKAELSPEDLTAIFSNVDQTLGSMYDEYRNIFNPISQETIDYVNTIADFMKDINQLTYDAYHNYVDTTLATTTNTVVDVSKIAAVTAVIDAIYDYRTTFANDGNKLDNITQLIGAMDLKVTVDGSTSSQTHFSQINSVLKEVTEYTDIPVFNEHDENEKNEAIAAVDVLTNGQFKMDMTHYLNNGIPQIIFIDNPYEYIVDGTLTVKGTFTDDNDKHDITVTFDGTTQTMNDVTTKSFEVQFSGLSGAYVGKELSVVVNDGLTSKGVQITNKPVISVSNPAVFTDMVKALEKDQNTTLSTMTELTLTELLDVFGKMIVADHNISPTDLSALYVQAVTLSGQSNGDLVNYVRDYVQANLLQWIYDNYTSATAEDFALAGVAVVTNEIIDDLKALIAEYKASDLASQTPSIDDYIGWVEILSGSEGLNDLFESIFASNDVTEVETLIAQVQTEVNKIPSWSTALITNYNNKIEDVTDYKNALVSVISSETTYVQADLDLSASLVSLVEHVATNTKLSVRLAKAHAVIEAQIALVQAETSLDETDILNAKLVVSTLETDTEITSGVHAAKLGEFKERLGTIDKITTSQDVVQKAEDTFANGDVEQAQLETEEALSLVMDLPDSLIKDELLSRLDILQKAISKAVAEKAVEDAEISLNQADKDKAQGHVDRLEEGTEKEELKARLVAVQESIDENNYITAEQAVTKAETSKYQRHLEQAQALVDQLKEGIEKESLQERLNTLKLELDGKANNILDRLVNGNPSVTVAEIADYTKEIIYSELLGNYLDDIREIADQNKIVTKEDVIEVVRVLNALEIAKRQMTEDTISAYQTVLEKATISIKGKYPTPQVMFAIVSYLEDDSKQAEFAQELANLLKRDVTSVQEEIDTLLAGPDNLIMGTYTVQYVDEEGTVIYADIRKAEFGRVYVSLDAPKGFVLVNSTEFEFELKEETNGEIFNVAVKKVDEEVDEVEVSTGTYFVKYVDDQNNLIHQEIYENVEYGPITIQPLLEGYSVIEDSYEVSFELNDETTGKEITVIVQPILETDEAEHITTNTIGEETAFIRKLLIASLDDVHFTSSSFVNSTAVNHEQYLYQASRALLMVKANIINQTANDLSTNSSYVVENLYDGVYKKYLLGLLGLDIGSIGEDGEPDLTPIYPYVPPVIPITPSTPTTFDFEIVKGTEAVVEKIGKVEKMEDGSYKWIVENPINTDFTLTASDMKIDISFDKEVIKKATRLELKWKHLGNEHYQLLVYADGKEIEKFNAVIELSKDFAYMLRQVGGQYKAMPYNYTNGKFNFTVSRTGVFYFSKEKITFNDIAKFTEVKEAIEELASRHIVYGVAPGKYAPNGKVTRAQFAAMLTRSLGLEASEKDTPFKDTKGEWFEKEVQALYEAEIIAGVSATKFNPNAHLTREEAATMLNRVIELKEKQDGITTIKSSTFTDHNNISDYAKKAVSTLKGLGIIHGKPDGTFDPKGTLTRSQMAKMLSGILKHTGDM